MPGRSVRSWGRTRNSCFPRYSSPLFLQVYYGAEIKNSHDPGVITYFLRRLKNWQTKSVSSPKLKKLKSTGTLTCFLVSACFKLLAKIFFTSYSFVPPVHPLSSLLCNLHVHIRFVHSVFLCVLQSRNYLYWAQLPAPPLSIISAPAPALLPYIAT